MYFLYEPIYRNSSQSCKLLKLLFELEKAALAGSLLGGVAKELCHYLIIIGCTTMQGFCASVVYYVSSFQWVFVCQAAVLVI
jgi:hypothetical protein